MSRETEICCFCGVEIMFRVIRGVRTAIHTGPTDCIGRRLYRRNQEGIPHHTKCPRCGAFVIFLRNNGGSVWLESLGWPWPKHPCFENDPRTRAREDTLPAIAVSLKGGRLVFAGSLGRRVAQDGIVVLLSENKKFLRRSPKFQEHKQWVVECPFEKEYLFQGNAVVVSYEEHRLITLDGQEFRIQKHEPAYYY